MVLWNIWNSRNNFLFKGKEEDARIIWERVRAFLEDFRLHNFFSFRLISRPRKRSKWTKPLADFIKINVYAACSNNNVGIGLLARDDDGLVLRGKMLYMDYLTNSEWAEIEVVREGFIWARDRGYIAVIIESDSASTNNRIKARRDDITTFGYLVNIINAKT